MKKLFLTLLFILLAAQAQARTFWVSKSASSQHCVDSTSDPGAASSSLTINQAINCSLVAGDTVNIGTGTYAERIYSADGNLPPGGTGIPAGTGPLNAPGISWATGLPVTIQAAPGATVTMTGSGGICISLGTPTAGNHYRYFIFKNITCSGAAVGAGGGGNGGTVDHIKWDNISVVNITGAPASSAAFGLGANDGSGSENWVVNSTCDSIATGVSSTNQYHCFYVESSNNVVEDTSGSNVPNGFIVHQYASGNRTANNNIYRRNRFFRNGIGNNTFGTAAALLGDGDNTRFYNNIIYDSQQGVVSYNNAGSPLIANNAFYNIGIAGAGCTGACYVIHMANSTSPTIRNNIIFTTTNITSNIFTTGAGGTVTSTNNTTTDPHWVSNGVNFHLTSLSTGQINTGFDLSSSFTTDFDNVTRPAGAWDIGPYEFLSGSLPVLAIKAISPAAPSTCDSAFSACTVTGSANNIITLSGISTQSGGTVTWACDRCSGTGATTGTVASWITTNITLKSGVNIITITGTDGTANAGSTQITVTFVPTFPGNTAVLLLGFENGSGTSATDSSGNANTGTLTNGVTWTTSGRFGKAVSLDGINDYVNVTDSNSLHLTQSWTISAYVQPVTSFTTFKAIVHKNASPTDSNQSGYELYSSIEATGSCTAGGVGAFANVNGASGPDQVVCTSTPLATGVWTHLAATYDNAAGQLKLYRNGVLISTTSASGYIEPSTGTLQIGASEFGEQFQGLIDEVRVYNFALPLSAGSNTVPGAACTSANWLANTDVNTASIIGNMNCPIINLTPPSQFKVSAGATAIKIFSNSSAIKIGANP